MPQPERFEMFVLGSGEGWKFLAWHMARSGHRTAVVELPRKHELSAQQTRTLERKGRRSGPPRGSVRNADGVNRHRYGKGAGLTQA